MDGMQNDVSTADLKIPARDGFALAATRFRPATPAAGVGPLGDFGFFRPASGALWEEIVAWLHARRAPDRPHEA